MRLFTFNHNHNPGRANGWTVAAEAVRLADAGMSGLAEGQTVSYDIATERGKTAAVNLKAV